MTTDVLPAKSSRWVPWEGTPGRKDLVAWTALGLMALFYTAMWPLRPILLGTNPVLLELLTGSKEAIIAAGAFANVGQVPLAVVVVVGIAGMMKFDALVWWAGKLWGPGLVRKFAGKGRAAAWFARKLERPSRWLLWPAVALAPWTPVPSSLVYAAAGWTGMRLRTFLVLDGIGTALRVGVYAGLGFAIGQPAVDVAERISEYGLWLSLGIILVIIAGQVWRRRGRRPKVSAG
ncbi:DedA family protein [Tenggerimyces flavus]|uniref:DedA family protein n=1 Tax=Tenggerimyces flavus TaxID=1708749 RepID=A0ABV7Y8U1_9ACTN|nr:VTT domain-containing protein [Tenggerimyces flavus]MBM7785003.1 membrane protein DedA with SNARE-associated domain [Tenggerimyces flavus]